MIKNVFYSLGINFINLLYPILLIPFYIGTLGQYAFGIITILLTAINLVNVFNDYSFYTLGPLEINRLQNAGKAINRYISVVFTTKLLLFLVSAVVFIIGLLFYQYVTGYQLISLAVVFYLFSRSQNTHWIFLGTNRLMFYFINNTLCRLTSFFVIYKMVKGPQDINLLFYILAFFELLQSALSYIYLYRHGNLDLRRVTGTEVKDEIKKGSGMFLTNLSTSALINSSPIILGLFLNPVAVGIYAVAEKIISLARHSVGVLFQGVFPYISKQYLNGQALFKKALSFQFKAYMAIYITGCALLAFFPEFFISFLTKEVVKESGSYLRFLSPIPLIMALGQSAYIVAVVKDKKKTYTNAYALGLVINLLLSFILIPFYGIGGLIASLICTELFITGYLNFKTFLQQHETSN